MPDGFCPDRGCYGYLNFVAVGASVWGCGCHGVGSGGGDQERGVGRAVVPQVAEAGSGIEQQTSLLANSCIVAQVYQGPCKHRKGEVDG